MSKKIEEASKDTELHTYFQYGVHLKQRKVFITSDIKQEEIGYIIKGLYLMDSEVPANATDKQKEIQLYINTDGGSEYDMFALHDVIRTISCPVVTVGLGRVMSAGPLLLAAGAKGKRWAGPNTSFMTHQSNWVMEAKYHDHAAMLDHIKDMSERWYKLMEEYTNLTAAQWKKLSEGKHDHYFDVEKALEYGLIDHIWDERKS